ncbi:Solute carrier 26 [Clydaea vesicula]|uniref:Solute carrier 26 n=1 Tax=Clydaea vesicula TaxID=447962 RepID=A0AAD5U0K5_9FUNG|nr:Solute carrier 26 [Clydaea vesicula]
MSKFSILIDDTMTTETNETNETNDDALSSPLLRSNNTPLETSFKNKLKYYIPVLGWLPKYNSADLPNDITAGLTVATLLIPQALSYAQALVKIPPVYGLYTCFVPLILYSLLGTSRQLAVGPEALVSILIGAAIRDFQRNQFPSGSSVAESIAIANLIALMVGIITFLLGFFRLGFLDSVLSRALLRGFVTAVAGVVVIDMGNTLLGIPVNESQVEPSPIETLLQIFSNLPKAHFLTAMISLFSIWFCLGVRFIKAKYSAKWDELGVSVLKDIKGGLISPRIPEGMTLSRINSFFLSSVLISVIGFVESIVVAKTYASSHNYSISPNRELVAFGVANIFGSIFGGWPAFGSLGRSAVNDASGAKTQLSGLISGIFVLTTTLFLLPLFYYLPRVGISLLLVVKHTTKTRIDILGRINIYDPVTKKPKQKFRSIKDKSVLKIPGVIIIRIEEGLYFGNSTMLKERLKRVEKFGALGVHPGLAFNEEENINFQHRQQENGESYFEDSYVSFAREQELCFIIFEVHGMTEIDASATQTLLEIVESFCARNIAVCFVKLRDSCLQNFVCSGLYKVVGEERFFSKIKYALSYFGISNLPHNTVFEEISIASKKNGTREEEFTDLNGTSIGSIKRQSYNKENSLSSSFIKRNSPSGTSHSVPKENLYLGKKNLNSTFLVVNGPGSPFKNDENDALDDIDYYGG